MIQPPRYLEVAVPTPLRQRFHYLAPAAPAPLSAGVRVRVPFGRRQLVGVALGHTDDAEVEHARLRAVTEVLDEHPILPESLMELCLWAAGYYHHPVGEVLAGALPALLRQGEPASAPAERLCLTDAGLETSVTSLTRAPRQRALLRELKATGRGLDRADLARLELSTAVIGAVVDKGLACWQVEVSNRQPFDPSTLAVERSPDLTPEQRAALELIGNHETGVTLLYGVTGSGKTEVYLRAIEDVLRAGRQALVLVPEIALTPQTIRRFTSRFSAPVVALHSGLTDRERLEAWRSASAGEAGIVIGTRSAVFTPLASPGIIVVDEEHDGSFKQQDGFRYHARDLAVMRAHLEQTSIVLGSATPSLESWHNARSGRYRLAEIAERAGGAAPARYSLVNLRHEPAHHGFPDSLIEAIRSRLDRQEQVLVFLNRRGFSPVLLCPECAWVAGCERCDARMTLHRTSRSLICHHCGATRRIDTECPTCRSSELMPVGEGTQRLEDELAALFPDRAVLRIDRDSTRAKGSLHASMTRIESGEPLILVGTQMLAKGHHFPNVTLVVIKDMDAAFFSANFRSAERIGQLVLQVGGRAGREAKPGVVAIETRVPDQPLFHQLIDEGYAAFADGLLAEREQYALPPCSHQALIRAEAHGKQLAIDFLEDVAGRLTPLPSVEVLGPVPASMERRAGRYRGQLLLSAPGRRELHQTLARAIEIAGNATLARRVRWSVDVDPIDLF